MKKLLTTAIALAMVASFTLGVAACGGKDEGGTDEGHTHSFAWVYNDDATCIEDGTETQHCSCGETGETRTKTGTKLGHDIQPLPAKEATCSESGYSAHNGCTRCGYTTDNVTYADALHLRYELNEVGDSYTVAGVDDDCNDLAIEIPYYYKGLPVTAIGEGAFMGYPDGDSDIVMPHLFDLESIVLPDSIKTIGEGAFSDLHSLESIAIPNGVTKIENGTFAHTPLSKGITLPESLETIGNYAFELCAFKNIKIPDGVRSIGVDAFGYCMLESITLPDSVAEIGQGAFSSCSSLKTVTLPKNLTDISNRVFYGCEALTTVKMPETVTTIGDCAFHTCFSLTSIVIPKSVTSIGELSFLGCVSMLEIWNFSDLSIEKGAETFGQIALYTKYVYTENEESKQILTDDGFLFFEDEEESLLLHYIGHETSLALPASSPTEKTYEIYYSAFRNDQSIEQVVIPEGVTSIGSEMFSGCFLLKSVTISESVTTIGELAFNGCNSIVNIVIPKSVTSIKFGAFMACSLGFVLYEGTQTDWDKIEIAEKNFEDSIHPVTIYYFSENEPTAEQWAESENWWHYDGTGRPVEWVKE